MPSILTEPPPATVPLPPESASPQRRFTTGQIISGVVFLLISGDVTLAILLYAPQISRFGQYGYPGVFLVSLIGNASIALPIPSLAVTFSMGAVLSWPVVGLVAGIGEAVGETTGYMAGYSGSAIVENRHRFDRLRYWMEHHGMLTIFVLSVVPNPVIDLAGITAGALKYAFHKYFIALWVGKTIKTLIFAWAGAHSVGWFMWFLG